MSNSEHCDPCKKCKKTKCTDKNIKINGKLDVICDTHLHKDLLVDGNVTTNSLNVIGETILNTVVANEIVTEKLESKEIIVEHLDAKEIVSDEINSNVLCLNDQLTAPPCESRAEGCLWVADPNAAPVLPPSAPVKNENPLHYQDSSCRDYIVQTTPTDPFHGYWIKVNMGYYPDSDLGYSKVTAFYIDTTKSPILIKYFGGTLDNLRELTPLELPSSQTFTKVSPTPIEGPTLYIPSLTNLNFTTTLTLQNDQKTIVGYIGAPNITNFPTPLLFYKLENEPIIRPYNNNTKAFQGNSTNSDPNDPVFMFDEYCNYNLTQQPMTNVGMGYSQYPGYLAFKDTQYKLKTTGIIYPSKILKVQRTVKVGGPSAQNTGTPWIATTTQPPAPIYMTVFETDIPHHANRFSRVTLAGFTGILSYLNGSHDVICNDDTWALDEDSNFMNPNTRKYRFTIEMDTCIPGTTIDVSGNINEYAGGATATVQIGPITPGSEYRKLLEVQYDFFYNMFQFSTHSAFTWYRPSPTTGTATQSQKQKSIPTFAELQSRIRAGTATAGNINLRTVQHGSAMATNLFINQSSTGPQPLRQIIPLNNPYGITSTSETSIFSYNIALENYMDKTPGFEPRNIWWRLRGSSSTIFQQIVGLSYYGDPSFGGVFEAVTNPIPDKRYSAGTVSINSGTNVVNGVGTAFISQMEGGVINIGATQFSIQTVVNLTQLITYTNATANFSGVPTIFYFGTGSGRTVIPNPGAVIKDQYFQSGNSIRNNFNLRTSQLFIYSRIIPSYIGGKNIGYMRYQNTSWQDPLAGMFVSDYAPPGTIVGNPRVNIEAACSVFSVAMKYIITTLESSSIIIDNRCSAGGSTVCSFAIANFLGDDRPGTEEKQPLEGKGFTAPLEGVTAIVNRPIYNNTGIESTKAFSDILVSKSKLYYPGTVLETSIVNPNPKLYILTDSRASSGGDRFPHFFLGTNSPPTNRNLGSGVKTKIFGDINGILSGAANNRINQTVTEQDFIVTNNLEQPIAFNNYIVEAPNLPNTKYKLEPNSLNNRGPWLYPDTPEAAVNYLGSGPWDNSWEAVAYPYLGAVGFGPLIPRLPGDARPNPNLLPLFPAAPVASDRLLWRDSWLEQTVFDAIQP